MTAGDIEYAAAAAQQLDEPRDPWVDAILSGIAKERRDEENPEMSAPPPEALLEDAPSPGTSANARQKTRI